VGRGGVGVWRHRIKHRITISSRAVTLSGYEGRPSQTLRVRSGQAATATKARRTQEHRQECLCHRGRSHKILGTGGKPC
jgi:hypothetical protein